MTGPDTDTQGSPGHAQSPAHDPKWDAHISELVSALAEALSVRLGQEIDLVHTYTQGVESTDPPESGLIISLSVAGYANGSVHLPLNLSLANTLANASFGQADAPSADPPQALDETRAQAVEDLIAVLAQNAADHLVQTDTSQVELAVSDRDQLPAAEGSPTLALFSTPSWQIGVDVQMDSTSIGQIAILIPYSLFEGDEDLDLDLAEDEPQDETSTDEDSDDGLNIEPDEMAALIDSDREEGAGSGTKEVSSREQDPPQDLDHADEGSEEDWEEDGEEDELEADSDQAQGATVDIQALHTTLIQASYQVEEELGALLGQTFELYDYTSRITSKQEFIKQFQNKLVITNLAISGDHYGTAFVVMHLADAITLGGTLIMLPQEEINRKIKSSQLTEDEEDAFGEVINILSGSYSHAFDEYFPQKLRLKKDRMTSIAPTKVDISSSEPFPDGEYFLATFSMRLGSRNLEQLSILMPPNMVSLSVQDVENLKKGPTTGAGQSGGSGMLHISGQEAGEGKPAIAIIAEDNQQGMVFASSLEDEGVELCQLKIRDKIRDRLQSYHVLGAFLVLKEIDDNSLATLIKVRSVLKGRCPLIIAGPKWTRSKVIQAVRYGAKDVLTTPPDPAQIVDKAQKHMLPQTVQ